MKTPVKTLTNHLVFVITIMLLISCTREDDEISISKNQTFLHIPDEIFETKLIELGIDSDSIVNQQMLRSDAEKLKRLDLNLSTNRSEISDLTGIEGFVNLTYLSVSAQAIEEVHLSSNIKLDTLILNGNHLRKIDLSKNSNLILVDIQSNELSGIIGLSQSTKLKKLNLSFNNFEEITINNASVEELLISHNLLKHIDTKDAANLKNVFIILNELTTIDFSSNELLETVVISGNKLQEIDLAENTHLTHLYSSGNRLSSLDISKNVELIDLRVDRNPDLTCIKIHSGQVIPSVSLSDYQKLNTNCL